MIVKLICPKRKQNNGEKDKWGKEFQNIMFGTKRYSAMVTALPTIASLTPRGIKVIIEDENVEDINFNERVDIVGITAYTANISRAYEIANAFRERGVTVVLGGVHVTCFPDEALCYADSVVQGEAEDIWRDLLNDFQKNKLKKFYSAKNKPRLSLRPIPRYDLVKHHKYHYHHIQTARGCSFNCDFCSAHSFFGHKQRFKTIRQVIKEIKLVNSYEKKLIHFCDDSFVLNRKRAIRLLKALIPLNITYTIQGTMGMQDDAELLHFLVQSGCSCVGMGFESINQQNLIQYKKGPQYIVDNYYKFVEKIQSKGIMVSGFFIFGFDNDDMSVFKKTVEFVKASRMAQCRLGILTPLPHTELYDRLKKERRLLNKDWSQHDLCHVCFQPKHMSPEELQNGYNWTAKALFGLEVIFERIEAVYEDWSSSGCKPKNRLSPLIANLASYYVAHSLSETK